MNLEEEKSINRKIVVVLFAVLCIVFLIASAGLATYYNSAISERDSQIRIFAAKAAGLETEVNRLNTTVQSLNTEIAQKNNEISNLNAEVNSLNSQITDLNNQTATLSSQLSNQPKLVIGNCTVEDDRTSVPYSLHIRCTINNTGGKTAYNALLQVMAFNAEGVAIDTYYDFAGITAHMSLGLNFRLNYTGSPITNWGIMPLWTDSTVQPITGTPSP